MNIDRRTLLKVGGVGITLLVPGAAVGNSLHSVSDAATRHEIDRSIKAGSGGSFSVRTHMHGPDGLTYADIEHAGTRYLVSSANRFDWNIVAADRAI